MPQSSIMLTEKATIVQPYNTKLFDKKINEFYQSDLPNNLIKRVEAAASFFLNQPYTIEALGEGITGRYSQEPLYRTDQFDCVTYTDTVLALAKAKNLTDFEDKILQIRYSDKDINYTKRTDWFTDLEWLPNVHKLGWLEDVTTQLHDQKKKSVSLLAETIIDKPNWYLAREEGSLHLLRPFTAHDVQERLAHLHNESKTFKPQTSKINYIPLTQLLDEEGHPNLFLFNQIPSGSVLIIVRPNWQIRDYFEHAANGYGTNLNVSHLGIAFIIDKEWVFFHASYTHKRVVQVSLIEYLQSYLQHDTVKGINIQKIV